MSVASTVVQAAPRMLRRFAPEALSSAARMLEGVTPLARRVASYGPEAAQLADDVVKARDGGLKAAGTVLQVTRPIVDSLTAQESTGLAQVLLGQAPPQAATQLLTPRTQELLRRGVQLSAMSGRPFAEELRTNLAQLSPRAVRDGKALFQSAVQNEAEAITQRIVKDRLAPLVDTLPQDAQWLGRKLTNAVTEGAGGNGALQGLRAFNSATLLGRAVLLNLGQTGLSTAVAGFRPTFKALGQFATRQGREDATDLGLRLGTALDTALTDFLWKDIGQGIMAKVSSELLRRTGFSAVERFNRRFAGAIGGQWFDELARTAPVNATAQLHLARHGVKNLAAADARDTFIQHFVRRTQFRLTPEELPRMLSAPGWAGELAKTAFQFKPFSLKATELLLDELKAQPAGFLARAAGMGTALGIPLAEVRRLTGGSKKERGVPERLVEGLFALGTAGMFYDAIRAAEGGEQQVLELLAGPTAGLAAEVGTGLYQTAAGRPKKLGRTVVRRVPTFGPWLAGHIPALAPGARRTQSVMPE